MAYKRFLAVGCTHGSLVNWDAVNKVLQFKKEYKPHTVIHLGDVYDFAAFRSGAKGTKDEAEDIGPDLASGSMLIQELQPTHVLVGNHDVRVWKLADHHNAIIASAAKAARNEFMAACNRTKVKRIVETYDINSWIELGDTKFLHGVMFSENAMRDHAEHWGKCVIAHLHVAGVGSGRRSDHPVCYCVGTLANVASMDYAATRRSTARWSHGFAYGEYNDKECLIWLSQTAQGTAKNWHLPR